LKVLVVSQYFWPEHFRINDLVIGLQEHGHEVTVLTGVPNYPGGRYFAGYGLLRNTRSNYHGAKVFRVPTIPRRRGTKLQLAANYLSFALSASLLGPILCRGNYNVVFTFQVSPVTVGIPAIVFGWLKQAPMVLWVQDLWPESLTATGAVKSNLLIHLVGNCVKMIYKRSNLILIQSQAFLESVKRYGADSTRIRYFPNTAESFYHPTDIEIDASERGEMPKGFCIMFAGNIGVAQDFGTILRAAATLRDYSDIKWVVAGDGSQRGWVEEQIEKLKLQKQVYLIGQREPHQMPRYFALADALLVTLKRDPIFEATIPSKVQSYLACGRPVLAALDGEGARILQEAKAGFTVPAEAFEGLADAVLRLYQMSDDHRSQLGKNARRYFLQHFERESLLDHLISWISELHGANETIRRSN
jgi:colanic acid biosynthesis glycosyl transferase WcaI